MSDIELLPCPWCGSPPRVHAGPGYAFLSCSSSCSTLSQTTDGAIAAWNRRASDPLVAELVGALEKIAEGRGRYSMDPLTHAANTIDDMKELANDALALVKVKSQDDLLQEAYIK